MFPKGEIETAQFDINDSSLQQYLEKIKPKVVLNTCGPFQTANYKIV